MNSNSSILKVIQFSEFSLWDVKRYHIDSKSNFKNKKILKNILIETKEEVSKDILIKYNIAIIEKINFHGDLFLRDMEDVKNYKGKTTLVTDNHIIYSKINVKSGCIYHHADNEPSFAVSNEYPVFSFNKNEVNGDYLVKVLRSSVLKSIMKSKTSGISKSRVKVDEFLNLPIPLPSLDKQNSLIKNYNLKTSQAQQLEKHAIELEQCIEKYLDELLGIKKSEVRKTTCLLSTVSFKNLEKWGFDFQNNSKVIYSKNYEVSQIQKICSVGSGGTPSRANKEYYKGDIPWIKTGEVINDVITDTEEKITKEAIENSSARLFPEDSLIIAMYGQGKTRGRTAKLGIESSTNQACAVLFDINENTVLTDYLWVYLMNEYERLREMASGNNQPNLNAQMIKTYPLVIPPIDIQKQIVSYFFTQRKEIKLLREQAKQNRQNALNDFEKEIFEA